MKKLHKETNPDMSWISPPDLCLPINDPGPGRLRKGKPGHVAKSMSFGVGLRLPVSVSLKHGTWKMILFIRCKLLYVFFLERLQF